MTVKFGSEYLLSCIDISSELMPYSIFLSPFSNVEDGFGSSSYQRIQEWLSLGPCVDVPQRFGSSYQTQILTYSGTEVVNQYPTNIPVSVDVVLGTYHSYGRTKSNFPLYDSLGNGDVIAGTLAFSEFPSFDSSGNVYGIKDQTAISYWSVRGFFDFQATVEAFLEKWERVVTKYVWSVKRNARVICRKLERDSRLVALEIEKFFHARLVEPRTILSLISG